MNALYTYIIVALFGPDSLLLVNTTHWCETRIDMSDNIGCGMVSNWTVR